MKLVASKEFKKTAVAATASLWLYVRCTYDVVTRTIRIDSVIERLQKGLNTGLWQSTICYSAKKDIGLKIMQGCLYGELAKPDSLSLPPCIFDISQIENKNDESLLFPKNMIGENGDASINLYSYANTQELSLLFSLPDKNVPGYELRTGKRYPVSFSVRKPEAKKVLLFWELYVTQAQNLTKYLSVFRTKI